MEHSLAHSVYDRWMGQFVFAFYKCVYMTKLVSGYYLLYPAMCWLLQSSSQTQFNTLNQNSKGRHRKLPFFNLFFFSLFPLVAIFLSWLPDVNPYIKVAQLWHPDLMQNVLVLCKIFVEVSMYSTNMPGY